eukprot:TRINITY_DN6984_c0_g1_i1.p1 TRINITY_DN6984_c0_g1~~TRINITY_DN6984_c0_g1_i1.p1  ORF type:complete len:511 (-),score=79.61 TRINITY_DN6984_c0_g1_i1:127-1659(-)
MNIMDFSAWQVVKVAAYLVGMVILYFVLHLLKVILTPVVANIRDSKRYAHLPRHPVKNMSFLLLNPARDTEQNLPLFVKDKNTGEYYDLINVGPDMNGKMTVYLSDPDLIGQVFGSSDATLFPKTAASYDIVRDGLLGDGLVTSQGETWRFHRHIITPLFHFKNLKDMIPMMSLYTTDLIKHIIEMNKVKRDYHYLPEILSKFTLSQIVYLAFGSNIDLDWMHRRQLKLGELFLPHMRNLTLFGPLVQYIPFTSSWELLKTRREVESYMGHIIDLVQQDLNKSDNDESSTNLIKTLLKDGRVTKQEIVAEAATFLFAGFDTTAVTLGFCLAYLATNSRWFSWIQEEVDEILGVGDRAREPNADDLPKLKRTRAVINEALRLRPPAPQLSRTPPRDVKLGGYDIPAGTNIQSSIFMVQRSPKLWKNPNEFDPSRWVDKDENQMQHPYAFIPFSAGLRNCIGKNFAIQEAIIGLSMILSKFTVELDPARPMKVQGTPVAMPFAWIKFFEREN